MLVIKFTNYITGDAALFKAESYGDDNFEDVIRTIEEITDSILSDEQKLLIKIGDIERNFPIQVSYYDDGDWDYYEEHAHETFTCIMRGIVDNIIEQGHECNPTDAWIILDRLCYEDWESAKVACLEAYWEDYSDVDPLTCWCTRRGRTIHRF